MIRETSQLRGRDIWPMVEAGEISLGGYKPLKIYGRLDCKSANGYIRKGQYVKERVLFKDEAEAISEGYRPCAKCLPRRYEIFKACDNESRPFTLEMALEVEGEQAEWTPQDGEQS